MLAFIHKYIQMDPFQYEFVKYSSTLEVTMDFVNY